MSYEKHQTNANFDLDLVWWSSHFQLLSSGQLFDHSNWCISEMRIKPKQNVLIKLMTTFRQVHKREVLKRTRADILVKRPVSARKAVFLQRQVIFSFNGVNNADSLSGRWVKAASLHTSASIYACSTPKGQIILRREFVCCCCCGVRIRFVAQRAC